MMTYNPSDQQQAMSREWKSRFSLEARELAQIRRLQKP